MTRNRLAAAVTTFAALTTLQIATPAAAQEFPDRTVRIVVPFPAGGTADTLPRLVAEKLRDRYAKGVIVENKPGAGGNIGAEFVYRADPDGHTLLASPPGPIAINHNLYSKLPFDPEKWQVLTVLGSVPNVLAVRTQFPAQNLAEFLAFARANPGKVTYASQGNGSTSHLTANLFQSAAKLKMLHVPYKGTAPALADLTAGHVDIFFDNLASSLPLHRAGKIRILAVADERRAPGIAEVPTFTEAGLADVQAVTWFALVAPPDTPDAVRRELSKSVGEVLANAEIRRRFAELGVDPIGKPIAESAQFIRAETEKWRRVIRDSGVRLD